MNYLTYTRFLPVLLLLVSGSACEEDKKPQNYERIERYESGAVSRRVQIVNGEKEGKMTDFYPDGKIMAERWFKNGRQDGRTLVFYPSGKIKEAQYYTAGEQHGGDTIWYEDGKLQFAVFFQNNKKNGYLQKWSPEGRLIFEAGYHQDTLTEVNGEPVSRQSPEARFSGDTLIRARAQ